MITNGGIQLEKLTYADRYVTWQPTYIGIIHGNVMVNKHQNMSRINKLTAEVFIKAFLVFMLLVVLGFNITWLIIDSLDDPFSSENLKYWILYLSATVVGLISLIVTLLSKKLGSFICSILLLAVVIWQVILALIEVWDWKSYVNVPVLSLAFLFELFYAVQMGNTGDDDHDDDDE